MGYVVPVDDQVIVIERNRSHIKEILVTCIHQEVSWGDVIQGKPLL
jgi:hypothetical protein